MMPADIGSWGFLQAVQEAGRLLTQHFRNFLPAIILCVFPASLFTVVHAQIRPRFFVPPPGFSTQGAREEVMSMLEFVYAVLQGVLQGLGLSLPTFFNLAGANLMVKELMEVVYSDGDVVTPTGHTESLGHYRDLALAGEDEETVNLPLQNSLIDQIVRMSKGKKLKAFVAILTLRVLYIPCEMVGEAFTPKTMATMGLMPWMAFLVTPPLTLLVTLWTSYLILVSLVLLKWLTWCCLFGGTHHYWS